MTKQKQTTKDLQTIVNGGISELLEKRFAVQLELEKRKAKADERKKVLEEIESKCNCYHEVGCPLHEGKDNYVQAFNESFRDSLKILKKL